MMVTVRPCLPRRSIPGTDPAALAADRPAEDEEAKKGKKKADGEAPAAE